MKNLFIHISLLFMLLWTGFLSVTLASCQMISEDEKVVFTLPDWPDYLPELEGWRVQVFTSTALPIAVPEPVEGQGPQVDVSSDAKIISLYLNKNRPCCIIASPITQNHFFKAAGTIYPYSQEITWSGGYAASLFKTSRDYDSSFNWEKLLQTLEEKQAAVFTQMENQDLEEGELEQLPFYNPWLLDSQEILEGIAYHSFSANKLKTSQTFCIELEIPVFSSYVPENEFFCINNQPYVTVKIGQPELFALRYGALRALRQAQEPPQGPQTLAIIISASSAKNISLEFISMPIYIEEI